MEYEKPKIEFYRQRTFSERLNVTFEFIRENWKPLFKYSFYLIMPVCLIQTFAMNSFVEVYVNALGMSGGRADFNDSTTYSILASNGALVFCSMIGMAVMSGLIYAMMQTYVTREKRLIDVTLNDFKDIFAKNAWKYIRIIIIIMFAFIFVIFAMIALAYVSTTTLILTIPVLIAFMILLIPLMLIIPVYIFERDIKISDVFKKSWKLGMATLWGMIGLVIVLNIIASIIQTVTTLPWYLTVVIGSVFSITSESAVNQSVIYKFAIYILGIIQSLGMYISMIIGIVGLAFHYFHAREKVEGVAIESNISKFDEL